MKSIFLLQWQRFRRAPFLILIFFALTLLFVYFIAGGAHSENKQIKIYTYADSSISAEDKEGWFNELNRSETFHFEEVSEEEARTRLVDGDLNIALKLLENDYRLIVTVDEPNRAIVENYVHQVFTEELRLRELEELEGGTEIRAEVEQWMSEPALTVKTTTLREADEAAVIDGRLHVLFGMTLFFSIFTILFSLMEVAEEKRKGTWNRLIVSPLRKWQIYMGYLFYCFTIGYAQILAVFLFFKYVLGFELGSGFGLMLVVIGCYTFAIVALGILLIALVKSSQQLQAVIPIVANAIAMLGGAFWPLEIVTSKFMLLLAQATPMFYALEALIGVATFDKGLAEIAGPLSILLLFGVICIGIGINLMERRS